jgi:hypothetical protein
MPIEKVEISVTTQSQPMQWGNLPKPNPPKITMNGIEVAKEQAYVSTGWKLLVIDATKDITTPASYLFNGYVGLSTDGTHSWSGLYGYMYNSIFRALYVYGNINQQLVILSSYGMDNNMPPTREMMPVLLELGAGTRFQWWETHCNPGSIAGGANAYISFPVNYVLIGYSSYSYGQGWEKFDAAQGSMPVTSTLSATVSNIVPG